LLPLPRARCATYADSRNLGHHSFRTLNGGGGGAMTMIVTVTDVAIVIGAMMA
jgi:hypothetical protein